MKRNVKNRKQHKGFSLIELVIVVAIIGILSLMIIPQFSNVTEDAREKTWNSNCQTVVSAISMYQAGNEGNYPPSKDDLKPYLNGGFPANDEPKGATYNYENNTFTSSYTTAAGTTKNFTYPDSNAGAGK